MMTDEEAPVPAIDDAALYEAIAQWLNDMIDFDTIEDEQLERLIIEFVGLFRDAYRQGYRDGADNASSEI
jgi:hypothetical protein